jgi:membrane protein YdbS with pleckstrin-like domain
LGLAKWFVRQYKDVMMKCVNCGGVVADDAAFCSKCGAPVATADDAADSEFDDTDRGGRAPMVARLKNGGQRTSGKHSAEEELWSGTYSPKAMAGAILGCAILTLLGLVAVILTGATPPAWLAWGIGAALIWGLLGLTLLYRRLTVRYRLTNYRFFHETGLLSRTGNRIEVIDVDDVTVHQGLIERLFGVGTIHISSSDRTDPDLRLPGIEDVRRVADLIDSTRRAERQRRGLHIESI